jgi:hypothetical protein
MCEIDHDAEAVHRVDCTYSELGEPTFSGVKPHCQLISGVPRQSDDSDPAFVEILEASEVSLDRRCTFEPWDESDNPLPHAPHNVVRRGGNRHATLGFGGVSMELLEQRDGIAIRVVLSERPKRRYVAATGTHARRYPSLSERRKVHATQHGPLSLPATTEDVDHEIAMTIDQPLGSRVVLGRP